MRNGLLLFLYLISVSAAQAQDSRFTPPRWDYVLLRYWVFNFDEFLYDMSGITVQSCEFNLGKDKWIEPEVGACLYRQALVSMNSSEPKGHIKVKLTHPTDFLSTVEASVSIKPVQLRKAPDQPHDDYFRLVTHYRDFRIRLDFPQPVPASRWTRLAPVLSTLTGEPDVRIARLDLESETHDEIIDAVRYRLKGRLRIFAFGRHEPLYTIRFRSDGGAWKKMTDAPVEISAEGAP